MKHKNKYDSWSYTLSSKESRKKVKRLRQKAQRRIEKYGIEDELIEDLYFDY